MIKYKFCCYFCGHEKFLVNAEETEVIGRVIKAPRCPKCNGFMRIEAEKYEPKEKKDTKDE